VTKAADESKKRAMLATLATFVIGLLVAWVGVRCLQPFFDPQSVEDLGSGWQIRWIIFADILITGALIGGGANGIHQIAESVVDLFKYLRGKVQ
jgi:hypothetical protein